MYLHLFLCVIAGDTTQGEGNAPETSSEGNGSIGKIFEGGNKADEPKIEPEDTGNGLFGNSDKDDIQKDAPDSTPQNINESEEKGGIFSSIFGNKDHTADVEDNESRSEVDKKEGPPDSKEVANSEKGEDSNEGFFSGIFNGNNNAKGKDIKPANNGSHIEEEEKVKKEKEKEKEEEREKEKEEKEKEEKEKKEKEEKVKEKEEKEKEKEKDDKRKEKEKEKEKEDKRKEKETETEKKKETKKEKEEEKEKEKEKNKETEKEEKEKEKEMEKEKKKETEKEKVEKETEKEKVEKENGIGMEESKKGDSVVTDQDKNKGAIEEKFSEIAQKLGLQGSDETEPDVETGEDKDTDNVNSGASENSSNTSQLSTGQLVAESISGSSTQHSKPGEKSSSLFSTQENASPTGIVSSTNNISSLSNLSATEASSSINATSTIQLLPPNTNVKDNSSAILNCDKDSVEKVIQSCSECSKIEKVIVFWNGTCYTDFSGKLELDKVDGKIQSKNGLFIGNDCECSREDIPNRGRLTSTGFYQEQSLSDDDVKKQIQTVRELESAGGRSSEHGQPNSDNLKESSSESMSVKPPVISQTGPSSNSISQGREGSNGQQLVTSSSGQISGSAPIQSSSTANVASDLKQGQAQGTEEKDLKQGVIQPISSSMNSSQSTTNNSLLNESAQLQNSGLSSEKIATNVSTQGLQNSDSHPPDSTRPVTSISPSIDKSHVNEGCPMSDHEVIDKCKPITIRAISLKYPTLQNSYEECLEPPVEDEVHCAKFVGLKYKSAEPIVITETTFKTVTIYSTMYQKITQTATHEASIFITKTLTSFVSMIETLTRELSQKTKTITQEISCIVTKTIDKEPTLPLDKTITIDKTITVDEPMDCSIVCENADRFC